VRTNNLQRPPDTAQYETAGNNSRNDKGIQRFNGVKEECIIHASKGHTTVDCKQFLGRNVEKRRDLVRNRGLCFYCLRKHLAKFCPDRKPCAKCQGGHSDSLHEERKKERENTQMEDDKSEDSRKIDTMKKGQLNLASHQRKSSPNSIGSSTLVPLMCLTAVRIEGFEKEIPFYTLVDSGADTTICTRELAEKLHGWEPRDQISIKFLEKAPDEHSCMTQTLYLKSGSTDIVELPDVSFIDTRLPYSDCIPSEQLLNTYALEEYQDHVFLDEHKVDMILGAQELRRFQVLETCVWNKAEPNTPLIGTHPLETIFWRFRKNNDRESCISAITTTRKSNYLEEVAEIVSAEHNISERDCLKDVVTLEHDLYRYYKDQLRWQ